MCMERAEKQALEPGTLLRKTNPHNVWFKKPEGLNSMSLYNQRDLEPGALKVSRLQHWASCKASDTRVAALKKIAVFEEKQHKNGTLLNAGRK